ncbi:MAG TPA: MarR family transcriptional regulator [Croceibacterium sp.]
MTGETAVADDTRPGALSWGFFDDCVGPGALLLSNALTSRSLAALAPFGLPAGSLSLLTLIHANPTCSQADLSRATGMSQSGVVSILDELERAGLAARSQWPGDRRRNKLSLTAAGEAQLREMVAVQIAQEDPIRADLSTAELRQLVALLGRAHAAVAKERG